MTDAEFEKVKNRVRPLVAEWKNRLWLCHWNINRYFYRTRDEYFKESPCSDRDAIACVKVSWEYEDAAIYFNCDRIFALDVDDGELRYYVVHELTHCLVNEMRMWGNKEMEEEKHHEAMRHEEHVVSRIGKVFCAIWDAAFEAGKESKNV